jgi:hypothetical protein
MKVKDCFLQVASVIAFLATAPAHAGRDASANGGWIGFGVPKRLQVGTLGHFYMVGSDQGACNNITPNFFRLDMTKPHWKEFYALVLYASAQEKPLECVVVSGCGTPEVWVEYCTVAL